MQELEQIKAKFKVGDLCKCLSSVSFRFDEEFEIASITVYTPAGLGPRYVYIIQFVSDGKLDIFAVSDQNKMVLVKPRKEKK